MDDMQRTPLRKAALSSTGGILVCVLIALSLPARGDRTVGKPTEREIRYERLAFAMGGHEVGTSEARDVETPTGFRFERKSTISVKRGDTRIDMATVTVAETTKEFRPVRFRFEKRDAAGLFVLTGSVEANDLVLRAEGSASPERRIAIDDKLTFASAMDLIIRRGLKDGARHERKVLVEEMGAVTDMKSVVSLKKGGGFIVKTSLAGLEIEDELDAQGRTIVSRTPALGAVAYPVGLPPPEGIAAGDIDVLARSTWPAPRLHARVTRVVYRVTTPDAERFFVPEDHRQRVLARTANSVDIEVTARPSTTKALTAAEKRELTSGTVYEAIDDPKIKAASARVTSGASSTQEKVDRLVKFVYEHVDAKSLDRGYAPAHVTLDAKEGDCTEHSVLLSALLRSQGIATRLVDGVVVDGGRAGYHEWVEAYIDGTGFVPVDPTFGESPASPARLKLAEGSSSPEGLLALGIAAGRMLRPGVKIEVVEATPAIGR